MLSHFPYPLRVWLLRSLLPLRSLLNHFHAYSYYADELERRKEERALRKEQMRREREEEERRYAEEEERRRLEEERRAEEEAAAKEVCWVVRWCRCV